MSSTRLPRVLGLVTAVLVALHLAALAADRLLGATRLTGPLRQVDLNAEGNLTSWWGSFLLLLAAGVAAAVAAGSRADGPAAARRWWVLAGLLALMSIDETAQLHDLATGPLRRALGTDLGLFHFAWVIPALLALVASAAYLAPLVRSLEPVVRRRFLVAVGVYVAGAVVLEMLGGLVVDTDVDVRGYTAPYLTTMTAEETLELVGSVLLVTALLAVAAGRGVALALRFGPGEGAVEARDARPS
ncbi:hypothetical protein [Nocardioides litoris]|uniref:hypothetical protein n=1 Tax=Nocardioides litoris TaxID=1926648 RepID=UPI00111CEF4B|nr:hypothetical protein [Nocardioides litoris]